MPEKGEKVNTKLGVVVEEIRLQIDSERVRVLAVVGGEWKVLFDDPKSITNRDTGIGAIAIKFSPTLAQNRRRQIRKSDGRRTAYA